MLTWVDVRRWCWRGRKCQTIDVARRAAKIRGVQFGIVPPNAAKKQSKTSAANAALRAAKHIARPSVATRDAAASFAKQFGRLIPTIARVAAIESS